MLLTFSFPNWARILLGLVVGVLGFLLSGGVDLHVSEELRGLLAAISGALAAAGFVPPKPGSVLLPQAVRTALTVLVPLVLYAVNVLLNIDGTLRGVLAGVITFLASVLIVPPQAIAHGANPPAAVV